MWLCTGELRPLPPLTSYPPPSLTLSPHLSFAHPSVNLNTSLPQPQPTPMPVWPPVPSPLTRCTQAYKSTLLCFQPITPLHAWHTNAHNIHNSAVEEVLKFSDASLDKAYTNKFAFIKRLILSRIPLYFCEQKSLTTHKSIEQHINAFFYKVSPQVCNIQISLPPCPRLTHGYLYRKKITVYDKWYRS